MSVQPSSAASPPSLWRVTSAASWAREAMSSLANTARRSYQESRAPASRKILGLEEDLYVAIVQWDAGSELPGVDEHGGEETVYVLEGALHRPVPQFRAGHSHPR